MKYASWAALLAVVSPSVFAVETGSANDLPPVIVTASRTPQTADEALAAVTVITREDIDRRPSQSVVELLRGTPGLTVTNQGGAGKVSAVFLRGTESDHVLVLIDGIKVGGTTAAGIPWHDIPAEQIERIEIVRGPRSSLYGSEAIGGVIQIFTRKGGGKLRPTASVGYGSDNTSKTTANLSGGGERSWFNLGLAHTESDGFNSCKPNLGGGCFANQPDEDGYRNSSVQARAGGRIGRTGEIDFSALEAWGHTEFDGFFDANDFDERILGARASFNPLTAWRTSLTLGSEREEREYFSSGTFMSRLETTRELLSWQNDLDLGKAQLLTLGADHQQDEVEGSTAYAVDSRDNTGVFAQYQGQFGRHSLQIAGRRDDNEQFGDHNTGSIAWGYGEKDGLRGFVAYGTAFKAPTFDDLYSPWGGNPNLRPEEAQTLELGLKGRAGAADWGLSVFRTDFDQLIGFDPTFTPYNIDDARVLGLEASAGARLDTWTVAGSVTLLDPENRSEGANFGNQLPRRARRSAKLEIDRDFGAYSLGGSAFLSSSRFDDAANTRAMGGYGLVDLRAGTAVAKDWRIQAEVNNVFDKNYETIAFYNQAGRNYFITLRYTPAR